MVESDLVLIADHKHPRVVQIRKLFVRRPFPKSNKSIYPSRVIGRSIGWSLQPDCDGEKRGIGSCSLPAVDGGVVCLSNNLMTEARRNYSNEQRSKFSMGRRGLFHLVDRRQIELHSKFRVEKTATRPNSSCSTNLVRYG